MIKNKSISLNGREYTYTYSDTGMMIIRDGILYSDALDLAELNREYEETDIPIEIPEEDPELVVSSEEGE